MTKKQAKKLKREQNMIKPEIAKIIKDVDENDCIGNHELVAEVAERYAKQRLETGQVDAIVMQNPFIRRYFDLLKLTEEDCSCGRIARCDSCCAASVLNEVEELVKTKHGRLFA